MRPRHKAREVAVRILLQLESAPGAWADTLEYHAEEEGLTRTAAGFAAHLIEGVNEHLVEIDASLEVAASRWRLDQMGAPERAVLRLATEELAFRRQEPVAVVIDEAVRLAKEMSGPEAGAFVNGILGRVAIDVAAAERARPGEASGANSSGR